MIRLLILGCSAAKRHDPGLMPATERYDGPAFRVLRKAQRERVIGWETWIRIVSAKHGLIGPQDMIEDYDQVMTPALAAELHLKVSKGLIYTMKPECREVFVNLGAASGYQLAIFGFWAWLHEARPDVRLTMASGGIGTRCGQMKEWLDVRNGEQP
jgi:hypothetical protein